MVDELALLRRHWLHLMHGLMVYHHGHVTCGVDADVDVSLREVSSRRCVVGGSHLNRCGIRIAHGGRHRDTQNSGDSKSSGIRNRRVWRF